MKESSNRRKDTLYEGRSQEENGRQEDKVHRRQKADGKQILELWV